MASNPSKPSAVEETPNDLTEENKCLVQLAQKIENLKIEYLKKEQLIHELELEKQQKEFQSQNLQSSIDNKLKEVEKEKHSKKVDFEVENEWKEKLKIALRKKFASALEYQNKMSRLRNEVLSSRNLDDEKISEEIADLKNTYENICQSNHMLQMEIINARTSIYSKTEAGDVIDEINLLIKQLQSESVEDRFESKKTQNKLSRLRENIEKISKEN